ncbi:PadR family transcriptional regulator [Paenibacillus protaetiae]|uniref:PadR family transcriptional regulator n=1 Tax=Paenibacillus protaetiae TaxID=2509456 RepID=A0A4P6EX72_9BACL|nr:PadR family transcriptional regulator [Paenibacillus protaetiae]QAY67654.1 PadR family transcriptional regulator [Paenibacillus protaetiae]
MQEQLSSNGLQPAPPETSAECGDGEQRRSKRYFGRGGVKRALLELLATEPMHGYQMIKALEQASGGLYVPSAGSIYPTLQALEEQQLIAVQLDNGKKIYTLTGAGRTELEKRPCCEKKAWRHSHDSADEPGRREHYLREKLMHKLGISEESGRVVMLLAAAERQAADDPERMQRFQRLMAQMSSELEPLAAAPVAAGAADAEAAAGKQEGGEAHE